MKPIVRVTLNGQPFADVPHDREAEQRYRSSWDAPLRADWDADTLTIAWLIKAQATARIKGLALELGGIYRMKGTALEQVEAAVTLGAGPGVSMAFRGFPVIVDESVPWCDFDVTVSQ